jgi:hypothetical protein
MELKKKNIVTQDETGEPAAIDQVEDRVELEMKKLEGEAKKFVADGMQDDQLARKGERMVEDANRDLKETEDSE